MAWGYWSATAVDRGRSPRRNTQCTVMPINTVPQSEPPAPTCYSPCRSSRCSSPSCQGRQIETDLKRFLSWNKKPKKKKNKKKNCISNNENSKMIWWIALLDAKYLGQIVSTLIWFSFATYLHAVVNTFA